MSRTARAEIVSSLVIVAGCIAVLVESLRLPPGSFEPLGSAPVPQATAGLIIALCLVVMFGAVRRGRIVGDDRSDEEPASALFLMLLTIAYAGGLHTQRVDFGVLTTTFLLISIWGLERFRGAALLPSALIAAVMGFGCLLVFTRVFTVDLPSWF